MYMYIYKYSYTYILTYACTYVYIYVWIYIYTYKYTNTKQVLAARKMGTHAVEVACAVAALIEEKGINSQKSAHYYIHYVKQS